MMRLQRLPAMPCHDAAGYKRWLGTVRPDSPSGVGPYGASTCRNRGSLHDMLMGSTRPVAEVMHDLPIRLLFISAVKLGTADIRSAKMVCVGVLMSRCV